MGLRRTIPPTVPLIDLSGALRYARVAEGEEASDVQALVETATELVEQECGRAMLTQTWELTLDRFPCGHDDIRLPRPPLQAVTSITYVDTGGVTQTLSPSLYRVALRCTPGLVTPAYGQVWPATQCVVEAVTVTYRAGYGDTAALTPQRARQAVRLLLAHWYENREAVLVGTIAAELPIGVKRLVGSLKPGVFPGWYGITE